MSDNNPQDPPKETEKHIEHPPQTKPDVDVHAHKEIDKGRADLVRAQKDQDKHLKSGGKSGISDWFGSAKEILGAAVKEGGKQLADAAQSAAAKEALANQEKVEALERSAAISYAIVLNGGLSNANTQTIMKTLSIKVLRMS